MERLNAVWEYPALTPHGACQLDLAEVMDLQGGRIVHHRIYWGWYGVESLNRSAAAKAIEQQERR